VNESLFGLLDVRYRSLIGLSGMDQWCDVRVGSCPGQQEQAKSKVLCRSCAVCPRDGGYPACVRALVLNWLMMRLVLADGAAES
jgi:hypothetical protein